jgi:hypothetical protein
MAGFCETTSEYVIIVHNCRAFLEWGTISFSSRAVLCAVPEIICKNIEFAMPEYDELRFLTVVTEGLHLLRCEAVSFYWTICSYIPEHCILWAGHCSNYTERFFFSLQCLNSFQRKYSWICFVRSRQEFCLNLIYLLSMKKQKYNWHGRMSETCFWKVCL